MQPGWLSLLLARRSCFVEDAAEGDRAAILISGDGESCVLLDPVLQELVGRWRGQVCQLPGIGEDLVEQIEQLLVRAWVLRDVCSDQFQDGVIGGRQAGVGGTAAAEF